MSNAGEMKRVTDLYRLVTGKKTDRTPEQIRAAEQAAAQKQPSTKRVGEGTSSA